MNELTQADIERLRELGNEAVREQPMSVYLDELLRTAPALLAAAEYGLKAKKWLLEWQMCESKADCRGCTYEHRKEGDFCDVILCRGLVISAKQAGLLPKEG